MSIAETQDETRKKIMEAAEARFRVYGFNKTTMAEIGSDCGMSAANLYRFFKNKSDIGAEMALSCLADEEKELRAAISENDSTAGELLEKFVIESMKYNFKAQAEQPRVNEVIDHICEERQDIVERHKGAKRSMLAEILAIGNKTGEFAIKDIPLIAEYVQIALIKFGYPPLMRFESEEELAESAKGVIALIINGLSTK